MRIQKYKLGKNTIKSSSNKHEADPFIHVVYVISVLCFVLIGVAFPMYFPQLSESGVVLGRRLLIAARSFILRNLFAMDPIS